MKNFKQLNLEELQELSGGKITKYPNGVYCNSSTGTCSVNWDEAWKSIGHIVVNGWVQHGPLAHL